MNDDLLAAGPAPQTLTESWSYLGSRGVQQAGTPLLISGDRLIGFYGSTLYALNLYTGRELVDPQGFPYFVTQSSSADPTVPMPVVSTRGAIYFPGVDQNGNDALQALRLVDGLPLPQWRFPAIGAVQSLIAMGDLIVLVGPDGTGKTTAWAVNAGDGSSAWGPIGVTALSAGAVGYGNNAIFFTADQQLFAVNTGFGDTRFPKPPARGTSPALYNINKQIAPLVAMSGPKAGVVICAGDQVFGFDINTGGKRWASAPGDTFNNAAAQITLSDDCTVVAAVSDQNNLFVLDARTGAPQWKAPQAVGYAGAPLIAGNKVFVCGSGSDVIASFEVDSGGSRIDYTLGTGVSAVPPVIGNGHVHIQTSDGAIHSKPYALQSAACFNGASGIDIAADGTQFDFDTGDFTIEAWVKSSEGGEIVCGYPTAAAGGSGFRFNVSAEGELRFAVTDPRGANQDLARSLPTSAADGQWHHVAAVRQNGEISFFIDAIASLPSSRILRDARAVHANGYLLDDKGRRRRDLLTQPPAPAPVAVTGQNAVYIAWDKFGVAAGDGTPDHFVGLMREVRLWKTALEVTSITSRMNKVLGPKGAVSDSRKKANEPHLLGNWHLDDAYTTDQAVVIENDVLGHEFVATFSEAASVVTDLALDMSAFPYLLDQVAPQWPYKSYWAARGEHDVTTPPALSSNGFLCFGTDNSLYGVRRLDGVRAWGLSSAGHSNPVGAGTSFYVNSYERGVLAIDAASGTATEVVAFQALPPASAGGHLPAPAAGDRLLAVAGQDGTILVGDPAAQDGSANVTFATAAGPGDLQFSGNLVGCIAGDRGLNLYVCDVAARAVQSFAVDSRVFTLCGTRVYFTQAGQLVVVDTAKQGSNPTYRFVAGGLDGGTITGLAAATDYALLAVTTNSGKVFGLSMATLAQRFCRPIPEGSATGPGTVAGYLNAPSISGKTVFCTSRSGAVALVDGGTGTLVGFYQEPCAVLTPAVVQAGTAFVGCASAAPTAPIDGAVHSHVFGDTVALRVGVDARGARRPGGYAVIQSTTPLSVGDGGECCVEAWVNADTAADESGGEIVSIRPAAHGNVGLRLFLDASGKIHFVGHNTKADGTWEGVHAQTLHSTGVRDGQWHHVAVARQGARDVRIYLDGQPQSMDAVTANALATADCASDTLEIRIGAPAYQTPLTADSCFHGMIGEVRLWETYLPADQISKRMDTRLRGDEFSLLACWDFTMTGVHDVARNGYDGALATTAGFDSATYWLCDLSFGQPQYPDLTSSAKIVQVGEGTGAGGHASGSLADTIYELTLSATKADGSPLPGAVLTLWYVDHPGTAQPDQIAFTWAGSGQQASSTLPDREGNAQNPGFAVTTDAKGLAVIRVATADRNHGPSLDVAADFMPANERLHVNVLIDNQAMAPPAPPSLMVQTKLIQDYHYSTGNKIDDSRSRSTYRAILTALNADNSPRAGEWLEISALDYTTIEVAGTSYDVNPHNSQTFQADAGGQLVIVVPATDLKTADLSAWAGFMHSGERVTIAIDQDAHRTLANVQGDPMKDPARLKNWKPDKPDGSDGSDRGPLLKSGYENHADDVAKAVRHVASATQPSPPPKPKPGAMLTDDNRFLAMRQPARPACGDRGHVLRSTRRVVRRAPVTPESVLASIIKASGNPDHVGFYVSFDGSDAASFKFDHFTATEAAGHMRQPAGSAPLARKPLGSWLSSAWHAVESAADQIADEAKKVAEEALKLAVEITDKVTLAIHYVDEIVTVVVSSIAKAMEVLGNFLAKIALLIEEMIEFLLFLFNWKAIIATHRIIKDTLFAAIDHIVDGGRIAANLTRAIGDVFAQIPGMAGAEALFASAAAQSNAHDRVAAAPGQTRDYSQANGVSGTMISSKISEHSAGTGNADRAGESPADEIEHVVTGFELLLADLVSASPGDIGRDLMHLLGTASKDIESAVAAIVSDGLTAMQPLLKPDSMGIPFHIPFVSEIYKWITGDELTLLDASCLVLAIPVNLVYGVVSGLRHFNEDASGLADQVRGARTMSALHAPAHAMALGLDDAMMEVPVEWSPPLEILIVIGRIFYGASGLVTDELFTATVGPTSRPPQLRDEIKVIKGLFGIGSTVLIQLSFAPALSNWVNDSGYPLDATKTRIAIYGTLAIGVLGDLITLCGGLRNCLGDQAPAGPASTADALEYAFLRAKVIAVIAASIFTVITTSLTTSEEKTGAKKQAIAAYWLFQLSNMFMNLSKVDGYMFTITGARAQGWGSSPVYQDAIKRRFALQVVSLATQLAADVIMVAR
jgi:outer membrane protein assembly factor BamB